MSDTPVIPELKTILGALIFGANRPLSVRQMRKCVVEVAEQQKGPLAHFAAVVEEDVRNALAELDAELQRSRPGFLLREVAGGYRLESVPACGVWLRHLLDIGRPSRLSRPALETLAIVAYRQPISKAAIEGIRGVQVDHILKLLMEMQLVRISGRSELPGRPFLYGTTQAFLEHFGLRNLNDLGGLEPLLAREMQAADAAAAAEKAADAEAQGPAREVAAEPAAAVAPASDLAAPNAGTAVQATDADTGGEGARES